jgi:hypothetical protein
MATGSASFRNLTTKELRVWLKAIANLGATCRFQVAGEILKETEEEIIKKVKELEEYFA